jgi:hypothetical protein
MGRGEGWGGGGEGFLTQSASGLIGSSTVVCVYVTNGVIFV